MPTTSAGDVTSDSFGTSTDDFYVDQDGEALNRAWDAVADLFPGDVEAQARVMVLLSAARIAWDDVPAWVARKRAEITRRSVVPA